MVTDAQLQTWAKACEEARAALARVYELRRTHSFTTEHRIAQDRADSWLIDCADPVIAAVPALLAEVDRLRGVAREACDLFIDMAGSYADRPMSDMNRARLKRISELGRAALGRDEK
jgi:hypothetical protein